jgi:protein TonB
MRGPRKIKDAKPQYPSAAKKAGIQGAVFAKTAIAEEGDVRDIAVVRGPAELAGAATKAIEQWRYDPAMMNGKPVAVKMTVCVRFSLDDTAVAMSLIDALQDPDASVRMTAMSMLSSGSLGKARDAAVRALSDIALNDKDPATRQAASTFLRNLSR